MLNNREWAILAWSAIVLCWGLTQNGVRSSLLSVIKSFLHPKILIPFLAMFSFVWAEVLVGYKLSLWRTDLAKDTVVWAATSGIVMFFNYDDAAKKPRFFRRRLVKAFEITVFIEVLTNLFVMNLVVEFFLQPLIVFLVVASIMPDYDKSLRILKKPANVALAAIGFSALIFSAIHVFTQWSAISHAGLLREFLLPVWLTIGLLPFVYLLSLYANYELAFLRINWAEKDRTKSLSAKLALVYVLNVQVYKVQRFTGGWTNHLVEATGFKARTEVIKRYLHDVKVTEKAG